MFALMCLGRMFEFQGENVEGLKDIVQLGYASYGLMIGQIYKTKYVEMKRARNEIKGHNAKKGPS